MESNFNNRDLERFLKQNADQYRMFPSERIWEGIHSTLHTRRRWYGIALSLLLITTAVVTWVMLLPGNKTLKQVAALTKLPEIKKVTDTRTFLPATGGPTLNNQKEANPSLVTSMDELQRNIFGLNEPAAADNTLPDQAEAITAANTIAEAIIPSALVKPVPLQGIVNQPKNITANADYLPSTSVIQPSLITTTNTPAADLNKSADVKIDENTSNEDEMKLPVITDRTVKVSTQKSSSKKLSWQLYLTPTVSYRSLTENSAFTSAARYNNIVNGSPLPFYNNDVNNVVNHKPDIGFQLGLRTAYPLSRWFSLTGGIQLSVSKYDIRAYKHTPEIATIALTDRSVRTVTNYRNTDGYKENWLRNFYFSASLPIGAELKLSDGTRNYFGIAGTLQPTYVLDNRAYLISTDYKNYAEIPSLIRRWNMNTSFEIFSAHTTGKVQWRVGPQVRYQVMSSFTKNYPIKEHLFDFGLKLGVQLK